MDSVDRSYLTPVNNRTLGENLGRYQLIPKERPTLFVHPGDRASDHACGTIPLPSYLAIISQPGSHEQRLNPVYCWTKEVSLSAWWVISLEQIEDFSGMGADISNRDSLQRYLQQKYPDRLIQASDLVTVYQLNPY